MVRVFAGENWFGLHSEVEDLISTHINNHGQYSVEKIDGASADYSLVSNSLQSVSMFEESKLVVIYDLSQNKELAEKIKELTNTLSDSTELIIVESSIDKRSSYYKYLKTLKDFKEFKDLPESELPRWAVDFTTNQNGTIDYADANYLVQRVGANQTILSQELTKLVQYSPEVSRDNIDNLTDENPTSTIFNLIDAVFSGDKKKAIDIYSQQRLSKVEPQAISGMMIWQLHLVALCLYSRGKSAQQLSSESGASSYAISKAQIIAQRMGPDRLKKSLDLLRSIELTSRRQNYDYDSALKLAILRF